MTSHGERGRLATCAWFTRDQIPTMKQPPDDSAGFSPVRLLLDMWDALQNRHYVFLLLGLFFLSVTIGTHETLAIYIGTFFWELTPYQIGWLILNNVIGFHLGFFFTSIVHSRFDKRWTIVATAEERAPRERHRPRPRSTAAMAALRACSRTRKPTPRPISAATHGRGAGTRRRRRYATRARSALGISVK